MIGRFYGNDPVGFNNVHTFNRYGYANNNPYKYVDPDGQSAKVAKPLFNIAKNTFKSGGDIRKASRDELVGIVENIATLADGKFTSDDVFAAVDLLTGFGKEAKNLKKTYFSKKQRKEQYDLADGKCEYCEYCDKKTDFGTPHKPNSAEADHDIPQALGGLTTKVNRKNSCRSCNGSGGKGGKMSGAQWKTKLGSRIRIKG